MSQKNRHESERCETCRFWEPESTECHRRSPVSALTLGSVSTPTRASRSSDAAVRIADRAWPRTQPDEWCGEWDGTAEKQPVVESAPPPVGQVIATQTFLGRIAPGVEATDPPRLLEALLNQLPPDIRRVIVRVNGLDGQPLSGLKDVAREFRMSRDQLRTLIAAGEKRLAEVVGQLMPKRVDKRDV
jgi:hypothetical protein